MSLISATVNCFTGLIIVETSNSTYTSAYDFNVAFPDGSTSIMNSSFPFSFSYTIDGVYTIQFSDVSTSINVTCDGRNGDSGCDSIAGVYDCIFNLNKRYEELECINDKRAQTEKIKLDRVMQLFQLAEFDCECGMNDINEYIREIESIANCDDCDKSLSITPKDTYGCTDPEANNYNSFAVIDDGSCIYSQSCVDETMPNRAPWNGAIQTKTSVPDGVFEAFLELNGYGDGALNGEVCTANINTYTSLICIDFGITDATGIGDMVNKPMIILRLQSNKLSTIDVSQNIDLISLSVDYNVLTSITGLTNLTQLESLDVEQNYLSSIDLSGNVNLKFGSLRANDLTSLDITNNVSLEHLSLHGNKLTSLDTSGNPALDNLSLGNQQAPYKFTSLDLTNNVNLTTLDCYNQSFTILDVSMCTGLGRLHANDNGNLATLNLGSNIDLNNLISTGSFRAYDCKSDLNIKVGTAARVTQATTLLATLLTNFPGYTITT